MMEEYILPSLLLVWRKTILFPVDGLELRFASLEESCGKDEDRGLFSLSLTAE